MNIKETGELLISIIRHAVNGIPIDFSGMDVDWKALLELSESHSVSNIVAYVAVEGSGMPEKVMGFFLKKLQLSVVREASMENDAKNIFAEFEKGEISFMPLKGYIMKNFYPSPDMRTMADIDLLIKAKDTLKTKNIMQKMGFELRFENNEEDAYVRPLMGSVELHRKLVGAEHKVYDQYYGDGWNFAKPVEGCFYKYQMSDEDFYVYHLVHLTKHYKVGGTGIRSILDIWIYLSKKRDSLDWNYIDRELEKLGIIQFSKNLQRLAENWFENLESDDITRDIAEFIFQSGVYGKNENVSATRNLKYSGVNKFKRYSDIIFPGIKIMSGLYPVVGKFSFLIPFFWIYRIVCRLLFKKGTITAGFQYTRNDDKEDRIRSHFSKIGL